jgi:FtsP/CotA-like multicopper oxidase with cupredoxin domain
MRDGDGMNDGNDAKRRLSRRDLLRAGVAGAAGLSAVAPLVLSRDGLSADVGSQADHVRGHGAHDMAAVGDIEAGGFDPMAFLTHFDRGRVSTMPSGQVLREYELVAADREIEVAPGVFFPAWTYNGSVPGPTIRCTEGDRVRVRFVNGGSHPHTIHFHGIHAADMDGVFEIVEPGGSFVYEFDAEPFGLHLYHCHAIPLKRHIHKGLYETTRSTR